MPRRKVFALYLPAVVHLRGVGISRNRCVLHMRIAPPNTNQDFVPLVTCECPVRFQHARIIWRFLAFFGWFGKTSSFVVCFLFMSVCLCLSVSVRLSVSLSVCVLTKKGPRGRAASGVSFRARNVPFHCLHRHKGKAQQGADQSHPRAYLAGVPQVQILQLV